MKILKDGFRADMERIKRELTVLQGVSIHVGILGDAGSDILMIAGVHEYGATISAKNVKHLAIPLNMEAKNAGSPRKFNDLRFIPISPGYGFLVRDRKHPQKAPGRKKQEKHDAKKHPSGGEEDPRPNEDYEWMYPQTGDLCFDANGMLMLREDAEAIAQNVRNNLLTWKGEFPLNTDHGTDWERVVQQPRSEAVDEADSVVRSSIFQEPYTASMLCA